MEGWSAWVCSVPRIEYRDPAGAVGPAGDLAVSGCQPEAGDYRGRGDDAICRIRKEPFVPQFSGPDSDLVVDRTDVQTVRSQYVAKGPCGEEAFKPSFLLQ